MARLLGGVSWATGNVSPVVLPPVSDLSLSGQDRGQADRVGELIKSIANIPVVL